MGAINADNNTLLNHSHLDARVNLHTLYVWKYELYLSCIFLFYPYFIPQSQQKKTELSNSYQEWENF